jgi:antitoxin component YwqK of YwqJK toxin-antitoxin module
MTRLLLNSALLLISLFSGRDIFAQAPDTVWNQTDAAGQKQGYWKKLDREGNLIYKGFFKDGRPVGKMERYYENGTKRAVLIYPEGTEITRAKIYYRSGALAATGNYRRMLKDSVWRYYSYYSKDLMYLENYSMGRKDGESVKFYPGGQIAEITTWKQDMKQGLWTQFFEDSTHRLVSWHESNQIHGKYQVYNRNQILVLDGEYRLGKMHGTWHFFDDNGREERTLQYENGKLLNHKELEEWAIKQMEEIEKNLGTIPEPDFDNFFERRE